MTLERLPAFPLLVVAVSRRGCALVAMSGPLSIDARQSWRKPSWRYVAQVASWLEPRSVLITHGSRLRSRGVPCDLPRGILPADARTETLHLGDACAILGCIPMVTAIAARLIDMYPEQTARFRCFASGAQSDRARTARPLLSALAVGHAVSVAHLIKFG